MEILKLSELITSNDNTANFPPQLCTHDFVNFSLCLLLELQARMLSAWQRLVQERRAPLLCPSSSHCCPHPRGFTPSSSPPPGSWHFRSLSSLRPWAPALVLSAVRVQSDGLHRSRRHSLVLHLKLVSFLLQLSSSEESI